MLHRSNLETQSKPGKELRRESEAAQISRIPTVPTREAIHSPPKRRKAEGEDPRKDAKKRSETTEGDYSISQSTATRLDRILPIDRGSIQTQRTGCLDKAEAASNQTTTAEETANNRRVPRGSRGANINELEDSEIRQRDMETVQQSWSTQGDEGQMARRTGL